jgi:PAS domain S-box-containing protein
MELDVSRFCRELVTGTADAIIYADSEGVIRFWNGGATRMFGFAENEAVGQSLDLIVPENLRERHWHGFDQTMRTGESRYGAGDILGVPALRKDGKRISVEFTILPFHGDDGRIAGIGAILRDVTARFEQTRALQRELAALRAK